MADQQSLDLEWEFPAFEKTIQLAASGGVRITRLERHIVDSPAFQRLRHVRQLGASAMVFPTAVHTRFDHSIGTLAMVEQMIQAINEPAIGFKRSQPGEYLVISPIQRALARLYALLHDIAHVPFGHTFEDEMGLFNRHDEDAQRFEHYLGAGTQIETLISRSEYGGSQQLYDRFKKLYLDGKDKALPYHDEVVYHLVSDTVCADLLDYVKRDSLFCDLGVGLEYRFLKYLYVGPIKKVDGKGAGKQEELYRPIIRLWKGNTGRPRSDTMTDLVRLLDARYMIAERVYFHHAKIAAGTMLSRAVQEALDAGSFKGDELWDIGDDDLITLLKHQKHPKLTQELARAYEMRSLYKVVVPSPYRRKQFLTAADADHRVKVHEIRENLSNPKYRLELENHICDLIGTEPGSILIYAPRDQSGNPKIARVNVFWQGDTRELKDIDEPITRKRLDTLIEAHAQLSNVYIFAHPGTSLKQRDLARLAFEAQVFLQSEESEAVRNDHYKSIVRYHLEQKISVIPDFPASKLRKVEEELLLEISPMNKAPVGKARRRMLEVIDAVLRRYSDGADVK